MTGPMGADIFRGMVIQLQQGCEFESLPDFRLPERVEALDGVLQAVFQGRGKHRHDSEGQTQSAHPAHGVDPLMGPLEARVIVELGVRGQAQLRPTLDESTDHSTRSQPHFRPGIDLMPVDGHRRNDAEALSATQGQILNQVETVQLRG